MVQVIWAEPALSDLRGIVEHISQDSPVYAQRLADTIVQAPRRLSKFPRSGRKMPEFDDPSIRELIFGSYRIVYLLRKKSCYVVAVINASRDILRHLKPGSWDIS